MLPSNNGRTKWAAKIVDVTADRRTMIFIDQSRPSVLFKQVYPVRSITLSPWWHNLYHHGNTYKESTWIRTIVLNNVHHLCYVVRIQMRVPSTFQHFYHHGNQRKNADSIIAQQLFLYFFDAVIIHNNDCSGRGGLGTCLGDTFLEPYVYNPSKITFFVDLLKNRVCTLSLSWLKKYVKNIFLIMIRFNSQTVYWLKYVFL